MPANYCFSFFGNKIITTGEGGMCITNYEVYNDTMRVLRDHGMSKEKRYWHEKIGFNYRMTNLQAAIGVAQLERIDEIIDQRAAIENDYRLLLEKFTCIEFQKNLKDIKRVTWLVSALITNGKRDELIDKLKIEKIDARPFFYPLGDMEPYQDYVFSNSNSKVLSKKGINFPTAPNLLTSEIKDRITSIFETL